MTAALTDLDRGLGNLLFHVGLEAVRRGEEDIPVSVHPLAVLVRLLVERGADAEVRERLRRVVKEGDHAVWEWVYTHGEPTGRTGAEPGQLIVWRRGAKSYDGIVVAAEKGRPTQVVTADSRITLVDDPVEVEQIEEVWSLSIEPRGHDKAVAAFYGEPSALYDLVARMWATQIDKAGGQTFVLSEPRGLAGSLARHAPDWLRDAIWAADDLAGVRAAVDRAGRGVVEAGGAMPPGTWCFLGRSALTVVLSVDPEGLPVVGLTNSDDGLRVERVPLDRMSGLWVPAATER